MCESMVRYRAIMPCLGLHVGVFASKSMLFASTHMWRPAWHTYGDRPRMQRVWQSSLLTQFKSCATQSIGDATVSLLWSFIRSRNSRTGLSISWLRALVKFSCRTSTASTSQDFTNQVNKKTTSPSVMIWPLNTRKLAREIAEYILCLVVTAISTDDRKTLIGVAAKCPDEMPSRKSSKASKRRATTTRNQVDDSHSDSSQNGWTTTDEDKDDDFDSGETTTSSSESYRTKREKVRRGGTKRRRESKKRRTQRGESEIVVRNPTEPRVEFLVKRRPPSSYAILPDHYSYNFALPSWRRMLDGDTQDIVTRLPRASMLIFDPRILFTTERNPVSNKSDFFNYVRPLFKYCIGVTTSGEGLNAFDHSYRAAKKEHNIVCYQASQFSNLNFHTLRSYLFTLPNMRDHIPGGMYVYLTTSFSEVEPNAFDIVLDVGLLLNVNADGEMEPDYRRIRERILEVASNPLTFTYLNRGWIAPTETTLGYVRSEHTIRPERQADLRSISTGKHQMCWPCLKFCKL